VLRLIAALAVLAPLPAAAGDWSSTFLPDRLASHLPEGDKLSLLVVPGGPESAEAAQELQAALRGTGRVELVMDDAPLGSAARMEDAAIVQRAANQPVNAVVVVRVFRSGAEPPTAVVAAYDRRGAAAFGFSARAGAPMDAAATVQRTAGQRASEEVAEIARAASDAYDQKMVGIQEFYSMGFFGLGRSVGYAQPYLGKYKREIGWEHFYEITGHKDLAARLAAGRVLKNVLGIVAFVGVPGALVVLLFVNQPLGIAIGAAAVVCWVLGYVIDPQPASLEERKKIADDYNASLRGGRSGLDLPGAGGPLLSLGPDDRGLVLRASF